MNIEMKKESVLINQNTYKKSEEYQIESDIIIPDIKPDILNVINAKGIICVQKKEIVNGGIKLQGKVQMYIVYFPDDENSVIRALNTDIEFSKKINIKDVNEKMNLKINIDIKNIETKVLNGRKINIKIQLENKIKISENNEIQLLKNIENIPQIQCLKNKKTIDIIVGSGKEKCFAKETIMLNKNEPLLEILQIDNDIINKDIKISYNKVLVKAESKINIMYLNEKNKISKVEKIIPITGFVDINNILENDIVKLDFNLNNIIIVPTIGENSSIYIEQEFDFYLDSYRTIEHEIIEDLYIPNYNLEYEEKRINFEVDRKSYKEIVNIKENKNIKFNGYEIYNKEINSKINKIEINDKKVNISGEIEIKIITNIDNSNNLDLKKIIIPFKYEFDKKNINNNYIETEIEVKKQGFKILNNDEIEVDIELELNIIEYNIDNINIIDNIIIDENTKIQNYGLVIYYVKKGDTLWKIAKKLGSTVNDIIQINKIENEELILPGEKLFIPKYCNRLISD